MLNRRGLVVLLDGGRRDSSAAHMQPLERDSPATAAAAADSRKQLSFGASESLERATSRGRPTAAAAAGRRLHAAGQQRLVAPRMSLLGKPIYLSASHRGYCRNTPSMRLKIQLRNFLEQPQGFLAWLYHISL